MRDPDVKTVEDMDFMMESDRLDLIFTLLDVKTGTDVELFLDEREQLEEFKEFLENWSVEYEVLEHVEDTMLSGFYSLMDDDPEVDEMLDSNLICRVYINRDKDILERYTSYQKGWRKKLIFSLLETRYHKLGARFYGFPEDDLEAFLYRNRSALEKIVMRLRGRQTESISPQEAVEKYSISESEKRAFVAFTQHILADSEKAVERQLELVRERKSALEDAGLNVEEYIELLSFDSED